MVMETNSLQENVSYWKLFKYQLEEQTQMVHYA